MMEFAPDDTVYEVSVVTPRTPVAEKKHGWTLNVCIPPSADNDRKEDEIEEMGEAVKGLLRYALGLDPGSHYAEIDVEMNKEPDNEDGD